MASLPRATCPVCRASAPVRYVREVGRVEGIDGEPVHVGVDYDTVTIQAANGPSGGSARLTQAAAEEFARLFVSACWQAGQNARLTAGEVPGAL